MVISFKPVFLIQKNFCSISKPDIIEDNFYPEAKGLLNRIPLYHVKKTNVWGMVLFNSKGETWTNQRRLIQPLFTKQA